MHLEAVKDCRNAVPEEEKKVEALTLSISEGGSGTVSNSVKKGLEGGGDGSPNYRLNFGGRKTVSAISAVGGAGGPVSTIRPVGTIGTLRSRGGRAIGSLLRHGLPHWRRVPGRG